MIVSFVAISLFFVFVNFASSFVAKQGISYDASGYYLDEASLKINMEDDRFKNAVQVLRELDSKKIMGV